MSCPVEALGVVSAGMVAATYRSCAIIYRRSVKVLKTDF